METESRQEQIRVKGMEIFALMEAETPQLFGREGWLRELMQVAMHDPGLKVQLFRFVDAFPSLVTPELVVGHLKEYFLSRDAVLPEPLRILLKGAVAAPAARITAALLRRNVSSLARLFIAGTTPHDALKPLRAIQREGRRFTVDVLGEAALSEREALVYQGRYLDLIDLLAAEFAGPPKADQAADEPFPLLNVSVKVSSLYSRIAPLNHDDSVAAVKERLRPIIRRARTAGGFVNLDMETCSLKSITLDVFTGLLDEAEFADWNGAGIALQAYLKETEEDLRRLISWARERNRRITIRLVKGAYWEYETIVARQKGWPVPVFSRKEHTDWNFERCTELMLQHRDCVAPAIASHNVRSLAAALAAAERYRVPAHDYEFQMLYGMAGPIKQALGKLGLPVRDYAPIGELLPGMAYLVRRLLENTSNESFLRKTFVDRVERETLLAAPSPWPGKPPVPAGDGLPPFANEPTLDFAYQANRDGCRLALARVRAELGREYPALIGAGEVTTGAPVVTVNQARPGEVVGRVAGVDHELLERALAEAGNAQPAWGRTAPEARASVLFRAAAIARKRRLELLAWQVLETGKNWAEADADVCEAIRFPGVLRTGNAPARPAPETGGSAG